MEFLEVMYLVDSYLSDKPELSDADIADEVGCLEEFVRKQRKFRGLPAYPKPERKKGRKAMNRNTYSSEIKRNAYLLLKCEKVTYSKTAKILSEFHTRNIPQDSLQGFARQYDKLTKEDTFIQNLCHEQNLSPLEIAEILEMSENNQIMTEHVRYIHDAFEGIGTLTEEDLQALLAFIYETEIGEMLAVLGTEVESEPETEPEVVEEAEPEPVEQAEPEPEPEPEQTHVYVTDTLTDPEPVDPLDNISREVANNVHNIIREQIQSVSIPLSLIGDSNDMLTLDEIQSKVESVQVKIIHKVFDNLRESDLPF